MATRRGVPVATQEATGIGGSVAGAFSSQRVLRPLCLAGQTGALGKAHEGVGEFGGGEVRVVQARQGS